MSQEIVYTSAPQGLKPGSRGFCTVASTPGMAVTLAERLESLSGYRHLFPPQDAQASLNPVAWAHLQFAVGGRNYFVLSRVADAGLDYSQRSNKIAHHLALLGTELNEAGPAWTIHQPDFMVTSWKGPPRILATGRLPVMGSNLPRVCSQWARATGDPGWGGVLAETLETKREVFIVYAPGQDLLPLLNETLALIAPAKRWDATFSTFYLRLPPGVTCQWKGVIAGSEEALAAKRSPHALLLDLTAPLGSCPDSQWVAAARSGQISHPSALPPRIASSRPSPTIAAAMLDTTPDPDLLIDDDAKVLLPPHRPPSRSYQVKDSANSDLPWSPPPSPARWPVIVAAVLLLTTAIAVGGVFYWKNGAREVLRTASVPPPVSQIRNSHNFVGLLEKAESLKANDARIWEHIQTTLPGSDTDSLSLTQLVGSIDLADDLKIIECLRSIEGSVTTLSNDIKRFSQTISDLSKKWDFTVESRGHLTDSRRELKSLAERHAHVSKEVDDVGKEYATALGRSQVKDKRLDELEEIALLLNDHRLALATCLTELETGYSQIKPADVAQGEGLNEPAAAKELRESFDSTIGHLQSCKTRADKFASDYPRCQALIKEKRLVRPDPDQDSPMIAAREELTRVNNRISRLRDGLDEIAKRLPPAKVEDFIALVPETLPLAAAGGPTADAETSSVEIFQWDEQFTPIAGNLRFEINSTHFEMNPIGVSKEGKWTIARQRASELTPEGHATLQVTGNRLLLISGPSFLGELKGKMLTVVCDGHKKTVLLGHKSVALAALSIDKDKGWRIRQVPFELVGLPERDIGVRNVSLSFKSSRYEKALSQTGTTDNDRFPVFVFFGPVNDPLIKDENANPYGLARFRIRIDLAPATEAAQRTFKGQQVELLVPQLADSASPTLKLKPMDKDGKFIEHDYYKPFFIPKGNEQSFRNVLFGKSMALNTVKSRIEGTEKELGSVKEQARKSKNMEEIRELNKMADTLTADLKSYYALAEKINPFGDDIQKNVDAFVEEICGNLKLSLELGQLLGKPQKGKLRGFAPLIRFHD